MRVGRLSDISDSDGRMMLGAKLAMLVARAKLGEKVPGILTRDDGRGPIWGLQARRA
jgi:hypothetical protein